MPINFATDNVMKHGLDEPATMIKGIEMPYNYSSFGIRTKNVETLPLLTEN